VTIDIRVTRPDEYRAASDVVSAALMGPPADDERWERSLPSWEEMPSYTAWDGAECVGHAGQFLVDTTVPGGARLPTGAVSRVGVLPTVRRRGVGGALMHELLRDADRRGLILQSLRASQATIYERFGYGMAGEYCEVLIDPRRAVPVRGAETTGSFRILRHDEIDDVIAPLYDRVAHRRVGTISRPRSWIHRLVGETARAGKASFVVVHSDADGVDDGYVHYETAWDEEHPKEPTGKGEVHDLFGATDTVDLALWQFVCEVDLVTRWRAADRPLDDLLRFAAHDARAYRVRNVDDEQWVRLVDVDAALRSRSYRPITEAVNVQGTDPMLPGNDGTWRISGDGATRTTDAPDIVTDIAGLSAAYLGGTTWRSLVGTGRATETTAGAADVADALFGVTPLPFCGTFF
jgi:predicted acetyltransferase